MERLKIAQYGSLGERYREVEITQDKLVISDEIKKNGNDYRGVYFEDTGDQILLFSGRDINYLYISDRMITITPKLSFTFYCGEGEEKSWLKLFNEDEPLLEMDYYNRNKAHIDFASGVEDWEVVNFAWHLNNYLEKIKENRNCFVPGKC